MKLYSELAEYYFEIEKSGRKFDQEIAFLEQVFKKYKVHQILDMGCGSGEHTASLQSKGYKIIGVDSSEKMIEIAQKRFPECKFEQGKMQTFSERESFDAILCLFGTFNYLLSNDEIDSVLKNIRTSLKNSGIFIAEIWNSVPIKRIRRKPITNVSISKIGPVIIKRNRGFKITRDSELTGETLVEVNFIFNVGKKEVHDKHPMRIFTVNEILTRFKEHNLDPLAVYGSYKMEKYKDNGSRIIVVAKKKR